ncbi:MAG: hypothetical protein HY720_19460 [Planctomycetes bacterium]|nr:hypothetical protein [Planctomycetota bacterium]
MNRIVRLVALAVLVLAPSAVAPLSRAWGQEKATPAALDARRNALIEEYAKCKDPARKKAIVAELEAMEIALKSGDAYAEPPVYDPDLFGSGISPADGLPGRNPKWTTSALDLLMVLDQFHVGRPMTQRMLDAGAIFDRKDVQMEGATLALYNPRTKTIKIRARDVNPDGSFHATRDFVATVAHEVWHAYKDQVVDVGHDVRTREVLDRLADWTKVQLLRESDHPDKPPVLANDHDGFDAESFADEYVGAILNDLVGTPRGFVALRAKIQAGEIDADEARRRWQRHLDDVKRQKIESYEYAGRPLYEVQAPPPDGLVDHFVKALGLEF